MSALKYLHKLDTQPKGGVSAVGYTVASVAGLIDAATSTKPTVVGNPVPAFNADGAAWSFAGLGNFANYLSYPATGFLDDLFFSGPATFHFLCTPTAVASINIIGKSSSVTGWLIYSASSSQIIFQRNTSGTNATVACPSSSFVNNKKQLISIVQYSSAIPMTAGNYDIYINGVRQTLTANSGTGTNGSDVGTLLSIGSNHANNTDFSGTMSFFAACRRAQSQQEIIEIAANPNRIFKSFRRLPNAGPAVYTMPINTGVFGITGNNVGLLYSQYTLAIDTGSYTIAGTDIGLSLSGGATRSSMFLTF
jgi:hypothetical protein